MAHLGHTRLRHLGGGGHHASAWHHGSVHWRPLDSHAVSHVGLHLSLHAHPRLGGGGRVPPPRDPPVAPSHLRRAGVVGVRSAHMEGHLPWLLWVGHGGQGALLGVRRHPHAHARVGGVHVDVILGRLLRLGHHGVLLHGGHPGGLVVLVPRSRRSAAHGYGPVCHAGVRRELGLARVGPHLVLASCREGERRTIRSVNRPALYHYLMGG